MLASALPLHEVVDVAKEESKLAAVVVEAIVIISLTVVSAGSIVENSGDGVTPAGSGKLRSIASPSSPLPPLPFRCRPPCPRCARWGDLGRGIPAAEVKGNKPRPSTIVQAESLIAMTVYAKDGVKQSTKANLV